MVWVRVRIRVRFRVRYCLTLNLTLNLTVKFNPNPHPNPDQTCNGSHFEYILARHVTNITFFYKNNKQTTDTIHRETLLIGHGSCEIF